MFLRDHVLLGMCLAVCSIHGLQWAARPRNGETMYACVGDDVELPWNYSLGAGEEVLTIQWFFDGRSQEMIAFFTHFTFATTPPFSGRVTHLNDGSIRLSHVTSGDTGNYTLEVVGKNNVSGSSLEERHMITLIVSDKLHTTDGQLHVRQRPEVVMDKTTLKASLLLSCGHFVFVDQPPYPVEWLAPSGTILTRTDYSQGYWNLVLSSPVEGGAYVCRVPQQYIASTCLHGNHTMSAQASLTLNTVEVKLTLMEAELVELRSQVHSNFTSVNQDVTSLNQDVTSLNHDVTSLNHDVTSLNQDLTSLNHDLISVGDNLTNKIEDIRDREKASLVAFHAYLSVDTHVSTGSRIIFDHIITNVGSAYSTSSGTFTAPISGLYFIVCVANPAGENDRADFAFYIDGRLYGITYVYSMEGSQYETSSSSVAVHMDRGQRAWVSAYLRNGFFAGHSTYKYTWFTGFLLRADV